MGDPDAAVIAHVIQLSVAPVFLLSGVAALLGVMTGRLSRVIERARGLEEGWKGLDEAATREGLRDLAVLRRRAHLASWAINACAAAGLLVCLVIAGLFIDAFLDTHLRWAVGSFFFLAMLALISGLGFFLKEVYLATHTLRIGPPA
jgi:hypothetical protein